MALNRIPFCSYSFLQLSSPYVLRREGQALLWSTTRIGIKNLKNGFESFECLRYPVWSHLLRRHALIPQLCLFTYWRK